MYDFKNKKSPTAIALKYNPDSDVAPKVTAIGKGALANQIIQLAQQHQIAMHQDEDLVKVLELLEINAYIPVEIYVTVAEILAYIYKSKSKNNEQ